MRLEECIKEQAHAAGFELAGIASAGPADGFEHLQSWLAHGFAGSMDYMARTKKRAAIRRVFCQRFAAFSWLA